jgi:hypothetical protein
MIYLLSGLLTGGVLTAVCWPLFATENSLEATILEETEWDLLQRRKEVMLGNIQDLDFEHKCGKLSDEDYRALREEMAGEVGVVLDQIDQLETSQDLDVLIRRAVSVRKQKPSESAACPKCNHSNVRGNKFCAECGAKL